MNRINLAYIATAIATGGYVINQISSRRYESFNDDQGFSIAPTQPIVPSVRQLSNIPKPPVWLEKNSVWQLSQDCAAGLSDVVNSLSALAPTTASSRYASYAYYNCNLTSNQANSVYNLLSNQFQTYGLTSTVNMYSHELSNPDFVTAMANATSNQSFDAVVTSFNLQQTTSAMPTTSSGSFQSTSLWQILNDTNSSNDTGLEAPAPAEQEDPAPEAPGNSSNASDQAANGSNDTVLEAPAPAPADDQAANGSNASNASAPPAPPADDQAANGSNESNASDASAPPAEQEDPAPAPADDQAANGSNASNASAPPAPPADDQAANGSNASNASAPPAPPADDQAANGSNASNASDQQAQQVAPGNGSNASNASAPPAEQEDPAPAPADDQAANGSNASNASATTAAPQAEQEDLAADGVNAYATTAAPQAQPAAPANDSNYTGNHSNKTNNKTDGKAPAPAAAKARAKASGTTTQSSSSQNPTEDSAGIGIFGKKLTERLFSRNDL